MKVLNLTITPSKEIDTKCRNIDLELVDLPKNLLQELRNTLEYLDNFLTKYHGLGLKAEVRKACDKLIYIVAHAIVFKGDLKDGSTIDDLIEEMKEFDSGKQLYKYPLYNAEQEIKNKNYGILIDAPSFMIKHLEESINCFTDYLFIKHNNKIVKSMTFTNEGYIDTVFE